MKYTQEIRAKYGITVRYTSSLTKTQPVPPLRDGWQRVVLILEHIDGYWEETHLDGPPDIARNERVPRTPVQSVGSTTTYLRRYLFLMALNLVPGGDPTDDNGETRGLAPLTPEQMEEIKKLIADSGMTAEEVTNFLQSFGVTTYGEFTTRHYAQVVNTLVMRQKQREETYGNG